RIRCAALPIDDVCDICVFYGCVVCWFLFFFFFSSRRRHTRSYGDWSSDVCSSDLQPLFAEGVRRKYGLERLLQRVGSVETVLTRSEERRVGKECRSRRWTDH